MDSQAEPEAGGARARPLTVMTAAALALVVAGVIYLRPAFLQSSGSPRTAGSALGPRPALASMSWQSPRLGWITIADHVGPGHSWLYRTSDGGQHWQLLRRETGRVMQVRFFDAHEGELSVWVEGNGHEPLPNLFLSADAGSTWEPVPLPLPAASSPPSVEFLDRKHGWAAVSRVPGSMPTQLYLTADGGKHWEDAPDLPAPGQVWFADAQHGWLSGHDPSGRPLLFETRDAGQHWQQLGLPPPGGGWTADKVYFVESPTVLPSGLGALLVDAEPGGSDGPARWLYVTHDGGDSWSGPAPPPGRASSLELGPGSTGSVSWWATDGASAWFSLDQGTTWTAGTGVLPHGWQFVRIVPIGPSTAWAQAVDLSVPGTQSPPWALFRTSDRGGHWSRVRQPPAD